MTKKNKLILLSVCIILIITGFFFWRKCSTYKIENDPYDDMIHKVDSLNVKIDSLKLQRDTILSNIDSSKQNIGLIELQYEKDFNTIINQPVDSDSKFFTDYLSENFKRFSSGYNQSATKRN